MNRSVLGKLDFDATVQETAFALSLQNVRTANFAFVRAFREARLAHGISLRTIAKKLHFSPAYISDIELGRRGVSRKLRQKMIKIIP